MRVRNWTNPSPPRLDQIDLAQPVDWSHPLARGLATMAAPWLSSRSTVIRDLSQRRNTATVSGTLEYRNLAQQVGVYSDTDQYSTFASNLPSLGITTQWSAVWIGWHTADNASSDFWMGQYPRGTAGTYDWGFYRSPAVERIYVFPRNGVNIDTGKNITNIQVFSVAVTCNGTTASAYVNGVLAGSPISQTSSVGNACSMLIGSHWQVVNSDVSSVTLAAIIYNRALTGAEVFNLWHPGRRWSMLRTLTRRTTVYVPEVAGGFKPYWIPKNRMIGATL
jgi:hypothetical protein